MPNQTNWSLIWPNFDSGVSETVGTSFTHFTEFVWFGVSLVAFDLDQWVLGNSQVSILDQFRCDLDMPEAKF